MQIEPIVFQVQKKLRQILQPEQSYLVAVSGGSDSMALAHACACLQQQGFARFYVCHVEHGLRGEEALRDMRQVQEFCRQQNLVCIVEHVDVNSYVQEKHLSIEDAARKLRYRALRKYQSDYACAAIVTAHNLNDQAETVLIRLLRGAGPQGLGGMLQQGGMALRPLLSFSHSDLEKYCQVEQLAYCHDSTNDDLEYTRNRVRHELLPYLENKFNPEIKQALVRLTQLLQEDEAYFSEVVQNSWPEACIAESKKEIRLNGRVLQRYSAAIRKRILRVAYFTLTQQQLDYERTQALDKLCITAAGGKQVQLPHGIIAVYNKKQVILTAK